MTTEITLPDTLRETAENFARQKGITLSELYENAIKQYLQTPQIQDVTEQLNQVYAHQESSLDPLLAKIQIRSLEGIGTTW